MGMKNISFLIAIFMCCLTTYFVNGQTATAAASTLFNWGLLWSGSWEENGSTPLITPVLSGTLRNQGEMKLHLLPLGLILRAQVLDRRPLNFEFDSFSWNTPLGDPEKMTTHFTGGLYHRSTGSRLLLGVLDEWGLSARVRNPWIRSAPYVENHKPLMADLKTATSNTKEDEVYLYLSSPYLELFPDIKLRGFVSTQAEVERLTSKQGLSAFSGGLDFSFAKSTGLLLETFYTEKILTPKKASTWFSDSPPLPEREFCFYAGGLLFTSPAFSVSADFAYSETFAWGEDIYCNLGITVTPLLPLRFGSAQTSRSRPRPLTISLAADGAGERFVNRDGVNLNEGFRGGAKIEWKGRYNSLIRLNSVLRGNDLGEEFNRSSTGFYYRLPAVSASRNNSSFPIRLTRISLSADRNAENSLKIKDSFSGTIGFSVNFSDFIHNKRSDIQQISKKSLPKSSPLGITFSGSVTGFKTSGDNYSVFPIPVSLTDESWEWNNSTINCELFWSPLNFQFRSRIGVSTYVEKEEKLDFSLSAAVRFRQGRLSVKAASPDFPDKWNWTVSWRVEKK
jgi:hypothetical protein